MTIDPIADIRSLGYTEREAMFLYLVAAHSGYFVRRQYDYFIDRVAGAIAQKLIEKTRTAGHVEVLDYCNGYRVYHLRAKTIYGLLDNPESQNRRRKGDAAIQARLIALDYVLDREEDRFLVSEAERKRFFVETRRVPLQLFTDHRGKFLPPLAVFPISLADREHPDESQVRFLFPDEGMLTIKKFRRYLDTVEPLLRALGNFELVYASSSERNFGAATEECRKRFSPQADQDAQTRFDDWRQTRAASPRNAVLLRGKLTPLLYRRSYPRIRRNEPASLAASRPLPLDRPPKVLTQQQLGKTAGSRPG
ncbi:MAG TPA: hypothetical protein VN577_11720 [Terriglobales bacterium]|nr:hypothetical protein [Terriglobales bacterium]